MKDERLIVNPQEKFTLSSYLFMQLMEPLGCTDGVLEAAWNFREQSWRKDFVDVTKKLAPTLIRWPGGCFSSYYRWKEAIGPRNERKPMVNILCGGIESNQVGTHEFMDFCRLVGADPLIAVNFECDGRKPWAKFPGGTRSAGPDEASEWVNYCNKLLNNDRKENGAPDPFNVRIWQIGNETSYDPQGYDCKTAANRTLAFAKAMRKADPHIELIGWGDSGWARRMLEVAGEELDYIAFHHHFGSGLDNSPLQWSEYRKDPAKTWEHLMNAYKSTEKRIGEMRAEVANYEVKLAMTESHFSAQGRNRCDVLSTWAAGVANARILNVHERNSDILKIATLADFCGTRLMTCAIMLTMPGHISYMMPVARVMALFRKYIGTKEIEVMTTPQDLDVTASCRNDHIYLHVVNTDRIHSVSAQLQVKGMKTLSGAVHEITAQPEFEVDQHCADVLFPVTHAFSADGSWKFPAASVSAIELVVTGRQ